MSKLYESYTTGADGGQSIDAGTENLAQTFTPSTTHRPTIIYLLLYRVGSPGLINISIRGTSGGEPDYGTELLATSFDGDVITTDTDGEWVAMPLNVAEASSLTASTVYCITIDGGDDIDASNYIVWKQDTSSPSYSGGQFGFSDDNHQTWSMDATKDALFKEFGFLPVDPVTRVTGIVHRFAAGNTPFSTQGVYECDIYTGGLHPGIPFLDDLSLDTATNDMTFDFTLLTSKDPQKGVEGGRQHKPGSGRPSLTGTGGRQYKPGSGRPSLTGTGGRQYKPGSGRRRTLAEHLKYLKGLGLIK